ncbi:MAG: tripartite tricarboxylate transporter substrate-binding protein [Pseudolabrys sp.]
MVGAGSWSSVAPLAGANKVRALAVTAPDRHPAIPDVPTTGEAGFPSVQILFWPVCPARRACPTMSCGCWIRRRQRSARIRNSSPRSLNLGIVPYYHSTAEFKDIVVKERDNIQALWAN